MSEENMSGDEGTPDPIEGIGDPVELAKEDDSFLGTPWSRRTFLKAAALGTAAAAVWQKGPGFTLGPAAAYANDLSGSPCTANDVTVANGTVINEPCASCSGTFPAVVSFDVTNHTGTSRYCVTLHIPPGFTVTAGDVVLLDSLDASGNPTGSSTVPANSTKTMYGTISGFPCNSGGTLVCIGAPGTDGRKKCAAGTCATVAWNTSANSACPDTSPPGGQCRHQRICIQGYGVGLACQSDPCEVACDGTGVTLRATVSGGTAPYTFTLSDGQVVGPQSGTTADFNVTTADTYTVTVSDKNGCTRTSSGVVVSGAAFTPAITADATACNGVVNFSGGASGNTGCTSDWTVDGTSYDGTNDVSTDTTLIRVNADGTLDVRILDNTCHTIGATVACGSCSGPATVSRTWPCATSNDTACS